MRAALLLFLPCAWLAAACGRTTCEEKAICPDPADSGSKRQDAEPAPGSGSGSGSSGGSGRSCQGVEDCTNGIDDDCNGLVDCADPSCGAGFRCVPVAPDGWSGPGILYESPGDDGAAVPPGCPAGFPNDAVDGKSDPSASDATCACACDPPANVTCGASVTFFYDSACANVCASAVALSACTAACSGAQTMTVNAAVTDAGACQPRPTVTVPVATWASASRLCGATSPGDTPGGCGAGMTCAARAPAPFEAASCVWQSGEVACADPTATRSLSFTGANDTRGCSPCTCGPPRGVTCAGASVTTYCDTACMTGATPVAGDGGCVAAPAGAHSVESGAAPTPAQGTCSPSAVTAGGALTAVGATTICCTQ